MRSDAPALASPPAGALAWLRTAIARRADLLATVGALVAVAVAVQSFVIAPLRGSFSGPFEDFEAYWDAATSPAAGRSPYSTFDSTTMTMSGFIYPPFAAVLLRPLALLDHGAAATLFLWIDLAALLAGAVIAAQATLPSSWPRARLAVAGVLVFAPATFNLWHGQANPVIFLLLALALRSWVRGEQVRCGALLGAAAAIKLAPAVLIVLLLRRRWWRGAAAMAGTAGALTLVGLVVMGTEATRTWLSLVLPNLQRDNGWVLNQTWGGAVSRLADHSVLAWEPASALVHVPALALSLGTVAVAAWIVRHGDRAPDERALEFGAGIAAMLLSGSIAWYAHDVHLLIPLLALAGFAARRSLVEARMAVVACVAGAVALAAVMPQVIGGTTVQDLAARRSSGAGWWLYLQLWSAPVAVTALILVACALSLRPRRTSLAGQPA